MRLRSFRMGRGPIPCLACLTRLIPHCCLSVTHSPLSTFHCSFLFHYFFHGRYLVLCLAKYIVSFVVYRPVRVVIRSTNPYRQSPHLGYGEVSQQQRTHPNSFQTISVRPGSGFRVVTIKLPNVINGPQEIQKKNEYNTGGKEKGNAKIGGRQSDDNAIGQSNGRVVGQWRGRSVGQ